MSFISPTSGPPARMLSTDEMVNDLCTALLTHEASVRAARINGKHITPCELELVLLKIARCEAWLRMLGKHTTLTNVRARMPLSTADVVRPEPRLGLDLEVDHALRRRSPLSGAVLRPAIVSG